MMKKGLMVCLALALALCVYGIAAAEEAPLENAPEALQNAVTIDEQLAVLSRYAAAYEADLEAGRWDVDLDVRLAEDLPENLWPKNLDEAVSDPIPEEMLGLKYIAVYRKEGGSCSTLLGSFLGRIPAANRASSIAEAQGVMILDEMLAYNTGYTGRAWNRVYTLYLWEIGSDTVYKKQIGYETPPNAGRGDLYGKEIPRDKLWDNARVIFGGSEFELTDEAGNVMRFRALGGDRCCLLSVETAEGVTSLEIPQTANELTVTEIGEKCLFGNENLESVFLPEGVVRISYGAFGGCTKLVRADLPSTLKIIGEYAFGSCYRLRDMEIPDAVQVIERHAFYVCTDLEHARIPASIQTLDAEAFDTVDRLAYVIVADGVTQLTTVPYYYRVVAYWLPASLTSIDHLPKNAVCFAPEGSFVMQWLQENERVCYACESPEDMPLPEYITEGDYEFLIFNGEAAFSAYLGTEENYVMPSEAAGCPVTRVLCGGFDGPTSGGRGIVVVPESVLVLDSYSTHKWQGSSNGYIKHLYITNPRTVIHTIFSGCTVHAPEGSAAQESAEENNLEFEVWEGVTIPF